MADHEYTATCHTEGCGNAGTPIEMVWADEYGPPGTVVCGPCGQQITDLTGDLERDDSEPGT